MRKPREEMIAETRAKLIAAGRHAFGTVGYASSSMDDFTAGAGLTGDDYDHDLRTVKSYPWWIAKRNGMTLVNEAISGSDFTNIEVTESFSVALSPLENGEPA